MAKYNPFAEKAGLQKIAGQKPVESQLAMAAFLYKAGFDLQLLGSERYVSRKLTALSQSEVLQLRELFIKNRHPRFEKEFAVSRHQPFGKSSNFFKCIQNADSTKMAKLIKLVGMLLQTKIYLFCAKLLNLLTRYGATDVLPRAIVHAKAK